MRVAPGLKARAGRAVVAEGLDPKAARESVKRAIAVAQTSPVAGDVAANLAEHVRLIGVAAAEGASVVVFPELSLVGYEMRLAESLAFAEDDPRLAPLVDTAASRSIVAIVGAPIRIAGRLHIGAFVLRPDRTIDVYTKHHLGAFGDAARVDGIVPPAEATVFEAGDRDPLVRLGDDLAALAVCADIGRPSHPERAAARGATIYLASTFIIPSDFEGEVARLSGYAPRHSMTVAFANFGGASGGLASAGRSAIWSDTGELLVQLPVGGSGVAVMTESDEARRTAIRMS